MSLPVSSPGAKSPATSSNDEHAPPTKSRLFPFRTSRSATSTMTTHRDHAHHGPFHQELIPHQPLLRPNFVGRSETSMATLRESGELKLQAESYTSQPLSACAVSFIPSANSSRCSHHSGDYFLDHLNSESLGHCFGVLHAANIRRLSDFCSLSHQELIDLDLGHADIFHLIRVIEALDSQYSKKTPSLEHLDTEVGISRPLKLTFPGAFEVPFMWEDFQIVPICSQNHIYKGRLMSAAQCQQVLRMSEQYAYANSGWRPEIYTLTNLDLNVSLCNKILPTSFSTVSTLSCTRRLNQFLECRLCCTQFFRFS